jgi:hypothetical protein
MDTEATPKRPPTRYANWCRTKGHDPSCNCAYPSQAELIAMRGAAPGERPMPKQS